MSIDKNHITRPWLKPSFNLAQDLIIKASDIRPNITCPACGEEEETPHHFLGRYSAKMLNRYSICGLYLLEFEDLKKVKPITLLRFARTSNLWYLQLHQGCALGRTDTASALGTFNCPARR